MVKRIPVAVLGATGSIGQRFVQLLAVHPWFELAAVTGSERNVGRSYGEACHWVLAEPMPEAAMRLPVVESDPQQVDCPLVFTALPSGLARQLEPRFALAGSIVCSNASAFRAETTWEWRSRPEPTASPPSARPGADYCASSGRGLSC